MGWRFRKRVSLGKFVKLNLSKSGISTTVGVKGFSVNFGKKGVYRNIGIPGTGLYSREKIADAKQTVQQDYNQSIPTNKKNTNATLITVISIVLIIFFIYLCGIIGNLKH